MFCFLFVLPNQFLQPLAFLPEIEQHINKGIEKRKRVVAVRGKLQVDRYTGVNNLYAELEDRIGGAAEEKLYNIMHFLLTCSGLLPLYKLQTRQQRIESVDFPMGKGGYGKFFRLIGSECNVGEDVPKCVFDKLIRVLRDKRLECLYRFLRPGRTLFLQVFQEAQRRRTSSSYS